MCAAVALAALRAQAVGFGDESRPGPLVFDPFAVPSLLTDIATVRVRERVAVVGTVDVMSRKQWVGGPTLEVTITDWTGSLVLAFLGRRRINGIEIGRTLVAGGTVIRRRGRDHILNPYVWLCPEG